MNSMIWLSDLQKETLLKVNEMIEQNKTFDEIQNYLYNNDYIFSQQVKNGYRSKTRFSIEKIVHYIKDNQSHIKYENTFVDLIKRKNGLAYWETIKIS